MKKTTGNDSSCAVQAKRRRVDSLPATKKDVKKGANAYDHEEMRHADICL
jgi:hypothetical protein